MDVYHFKNFEMLDPEAGELRGGHELVVEGDTIKEVSAKPIQLAKASVIDCGGRTLMPGLIDSHVHVVLSEVVIRNMENVPLTLMTARAARLMHRMLDRGFTSVRDTGGADWGLKEATDKGLLPGPRLFIAGRAIGPTGGHSDGRRRTDFGSRCQCCNALSFSMGIADGITEVRRAVREEMRQGCDQVKIMMSGGVASPYDPLDSLQFSVGEVEAAVQEAHAFGRYVCAHAYTPEAITRAAQCRRAHHRARQSDRRCVRQADGREGHVPGRQPRHLFRDEEACRRVRHEFGHAGQERPRHRRRPEIARNLQAPRRPGRLRHRPARRVAGGAVARSSRCARRCCRRPRSSAPPPRSAPRSRAWRARSAA